MAAIAEETRNKGRVMFILSIVIYGWNATVWSNTSRNREIYHHSPLGVDRESEAETYFRSRAARSTPEAVADDDVTTLWYVIIYYCDVYTQLARTKIRCTYVREKITVYNIRVLRTTQVFSDPRTRYCWWTYWILNEE